MRGLRLTEENLLELDHPGVREQQGGIAFGNDRRALHDPMVTGREEVQETRSNLSTARHALYSSSPRISVTTSGGCPRPTKKRNARARSARDPGRPSPKRR